MTLSTALLLAFLIGVLTGLRALTPVAVLTWGAHLHWVRFEGTHHAFLGSKIALVIFTLAALGELVRDKLPNTPSRTELSGLIPRILLGALCGASIGLLCEAVAGHAAILLGALAGAVGGVAGCFGGYRARVGLTKALGVPDFVVAILEDLVAIGGSLLLISRF